MKRQAEGEAANASKKVTSAESKLDGNDDTKKDDLVESQQEVEEEEEPMKSMADIIITDFQVRT